MLSAKICTLQSIAVSVFKAISNPISTALNLREGLYVIFGIYKGNLTSPRQKRGALPLPFKKYNMKTCTFPCKHGNTRFCFILLENFPHDSEIHPQPHSHPFLNQRGRCQTCFPPQCLLDKQSKTLQGEGF